MSIKRWATVDGRLLAAVLRVTGTDQLILMGFAAVAELNQQFGSFLAGVDQFDAAALGVSPAEALLMDPQQRLVMQSFSGKFALVAIWFVEVSHSN
jgi:hypothetical protein